MSELESVLSEAVERILVQNCDAQALAAAEDGVWQADLWALLVEAGLPWLLVPERDGGVGASITDACAVVSRFGRHAVPLPIVETILANHWLARVGAPATEQVLSIACPPGPQDVSLQPTQAGWRLQARLTRVPWASHVATIVTVVREDDGASRLVRLDRSVCRVVEGRSPAGEPLDTVGYDGELATGNVWPVDVAAVDEFIEFGALARCHQMVGAMQWALERCVAYSQERQQFGRAIGQFQAVQHQLAALAGATAAAASAASAAAQVSESGRAGGADRDSVALAIAFAKARVGEAAGEVAGIAQQVHGAIGYSLEYPLNYRTRRLWTWREDFGSEHYWQIEAGRRLARVGSARLWTAIADCDGLAGAAP